MGGKEAKERQVGFWIEDRGGSTPERKLCPTIGGQALTSCEVPTEKGKNERSPDSRALVKFELQQSPKTTPSSPYCHAQKQLPESLWVHRSLIFVPKTTKSAIGQAERPGNNT